jgi:glycosyltransferase involved in cell wall biosynthesis
MHLPFGAIRTKSAGPLTWAERLPLRWAWRQIRKDRLFLSRFNEVLSVSYRFGQLLEDTGLNPDCGITVVPNGVDTSRYRPRKRRSSCEEPLVIGAAGNLSGQKRFDLLLEAFQAVWKSTDLPIELRIAGEGPERDVLLEQAERLCIGPHVHLTGFQSDMPSFLGELDVFVMTSDSEAAPYAALEAMACGLPSVVTDVGDLGYIVEDGLNGIVVAPGDSVTIAVALERLVSDQSLRQQLGEAARKRAVAEFSSDAWRKRTAEYFRFQLGG